MSTIYGNPILMGGGKKRVEWHQCPEAVRNYLASVTYDSSDYTNSQIANYAPATHVTANTKPIGKTVGGVTYYNEVPNVETPFSADSAAGTWVLTGLVLHQLFIMIQLTLLLDVQVNTLAQ